MSLEEIAALPVRDLGRPHSVLWLWATWPLLPRQIEIVEAWGYRYVTGGAWHKKTVHGLTAFGTGYRLRCACEPFLIGVSGKPETARDVRNIVEGLARQHSRKPDEAFHAAERLMAGACRLPSGEPAGTREELHQAFFDRHGRRLRLVEVFSRQRRDGWDAWGDEVAKFNGDDHG